MLSCAVRDQAPYKTVMTHGFVVNQDGSKISKSKQGEKDKNGKPKKVKPTEPTDVHHWFEFENPLRSPTAEAVFAEYDRVETDSAGISNDTDVILSEEQIEWADHILLMEAVHRQKLNRKYGHALRGKAITVLNIPDNYEYNTTYKNFLV